MLGLPFSLLAGRWVALIGEGLGSERNDPDGADSGIFCGRKKHGKKPSRRKGGNGHRECNTIQFIRISYTYLILK